MRPLFVAEREIYPRRMIRFRLLEFCLAALLALAFVAGPALRSAPSATPADTGHHVAQMEPSAGPCAEMTGKSLKDCAAACATMPVVLPAALQLLAHRRDSLHHAGWSERLAGRRPPPEHRPPRGSSLV
ncbi:hypothetical protein EBL89_17810 [Cereibacter sphaeroides]|nr:hypothetical protein EBL89_17810 [Cereibacter sphaeroides]AZB61440.1 hypothetical protein EBL88_17910 [Cereibacter sphaeroides]